MSPPLCAVSYALGIDNEPLYCVLGRRRQVQGRFTPVPAGAQA